MERTLTSHEVAHLLGVNIKTIQRWESEGPPQACGSNGYYYTEDQILAFRHQRLGPPRARKIVAYCRVSSQRQRPDLKNQRLALEPFCTARGFANVESIEEVGGGMNFRRKRFLALMDAVDAGEIGTVLV